MCPIQQRRRLTHELKATKFLSFHILVASLVLNQSWRGPERQKWQEGERGRQKEKGWWKHLWRNGLEMTLKSPCFKSVLLFKMQTLQIESRIKIFMSLTHRMFWLMSDSGEFNKNWFLRWESISGQTNEAWGQQRRTQSTNGTWLYTSTSLLPSPTGAHPSIHATRRNKFSFPLRRARPGVTLLNSWWARAAALQWLPDQRAARAQGSSLTEAIIKTKVMF